MGSNDQGNLKSYLTDQWNLAISYMYGENDVKFVSDPISNNASDTVMEVLYAAGSYAPSGAKSNSGSTGGTEFYTTPDSNNASYDSMLLRYDLAFASNFDWVLGGKLPGLFGGINFINPIHCTCLVIYAFFSLSLSPLGPPGKGCSGGNKADGSNCFSTRIMWRQGGMCTLFAAYCLCIFMHVCKIVFLKLQVLARRMHTYPIATSAVIATSNVMMNMVSVFLVASSSSRPTSGPPSKSTSRLITHRNPTVSSRFGRTALSRSTSRISNTEPPMLLQ